MQTQRQSATPHAAPAEVDASWWHERVRVLRDGVVQVQRGPSDLGLVLMVAFLAVVGCVGVYYGTAWRSLVSTGNDMAGLQKHVVGLAAAAAAMLLVRRVDMRVWYRVVPLLVLSAVIMQAMVYVPGISRTFNGSTRWFQIGPLPAFQPAEWTKLVSVLVASWFVTRKERELHGAVDRNSSRFVAWLRATATSVLMPGLYVVTMGALLMSQPDLGSTLIVTGIVFMLVFVGGMPWSVVVSVGAVLVGLVGYFLTAAQYRMDRLSAWQDPFDTLQTTGYQLGSSLIALSRGGLTGTGYPDARGWYNNVPELQNDFVMAGIGEVYGLVGMMTVALLFLGFVWRGVRISSQARDSFSHFVAFGISMWVLAQATINLCVVTGVAPTKGLTLPFVSSGNSSLLVMGIAVGILLNISQRNPERAHVIAWEQDRLRAHARNSEQARARTEDARRNRVNQEAASV